MDFLKAIVIQPFAWLLLQLYDFTASYGLSLILFAVVAKLILLPFAVKGKKGMMQMSRLNPKLQQLQKQYGKDRVRYNEEMQKLYKKEKVSPMSGCLWSLLPLPVMIALYTVIQKPLTNLMHIAAEQIEVIRTMLTDMGITLTSSAAYEQLEMAQHISNNFEVFKAKIPELINIDFNFIGLNLSQIPQFNIFKYGSFTWAYIGLFLIPFISGATAFYSARIGMKTNATGNTGNAMADRTSKQMVYTMPLISIWISFVMPAGLGIYWITNNVLTILQELIIGRRLKRKFDEAEAKRAELDALEAEEERRRRAEAVAQRMQENKGKGAKAAQPKKKTTKPTLEPTSDRGRVDNRPYARGRAYDPNRFGDMPGERKQQADKGIAAIPEEPVEEENRMISAGGGVAAASDAIENIKAEEDEAGEEGNTEEADNEGAEVEGEDEVEDDK